jgi:hypothetical protein
MATAGRKGDGVRSVTGEDIERLASLLALLVSDSGEADNAARALGALARKLGLSGGQLKALFMSGVRSVVADVPRVAEQAARIEALTNEVGALRDTLRKAEVAARALQRDRDSLRDEVAHLNRQFDQRRGARRGRLAVWLVAAAVVAGAIWLATYGPRLRLFAQDRPLTATGTPIYHTATVRDQATAIYREPDSTSPQLTMLSVGTHLIVHRTLWHNLQQWVEVEWSGHTGYVPSIDVDLS